MADESGKPGGASQSDDKPSTTYGAAAEGAQRKTQTGIICAKCGVQVAPGYPKCPKCHAAMPNVVSPLAKTTGGGGGTSAAGDEGGNTALWFAVGAVVLLAGAVVIWQARGGGSSTSGAAAPDLPDGGELVVYEDGGEDVVAFIDAGPQSDAAAYDIALDELDAVLSQRRLWSTVDVEVDADEVVRIDTNMCGEDGLLAAIDETADKLKATGFTSVRCYSKHGRLVFEKPLE